MNESVKKIQDFLSVDTAALIFSSPNRFYLTNFNTDAGIVFITKHSAMFFTDQRYLEKAKEMSVIPVKNIENYTEQINGICTLNGIKNILTETTYVDVSRFKLLKEKFTAELLDSDELDLLFTKMRSVKSKSEISLIKASQELTDETFRYILPRIEAGRTEREIMLDMEFFMRKNGSDGVAFDFIVVSGKNTSLPHGVPTEKRIENGDFVTLDFGAVIGGYRSDMTRTVAVGNITDTQKAVYDTVLKAQLSALGGIAAGTRCRDVDKIARDIIDAEYSGLFGHGLGHGVGIEIHEAPSFNTRDNTVLLPGTVMTVEPGIYLPGKFGVRIEDMIIATENGHENITKSNKELIIL